ncbi:BET1 homolog [Amphiura filiformis]|uniref:BET1 homolog n=1 Tax=Amphiura filiformis TaxID=82378 RepID=UPI003B214FF3
MRRAAGLQDGHSGGGTYNALEEENEHLAAGLSSKVQALKSLTIDIGEEVRTQNKELNRMDDDFDASGGLLASTMSRVQRMARSGSHRYICYLMLFAMFVFFVIYLIMKMR